MNALLLSLGLLLETPILALILRSESLPDAQRAWILTAHFLACLLMSPTLSTAVRERYRIRPLPAYLWSWGLAFSMPALGAILLLILIFLDKHIKSKEEETDDFVLGNLMDQETSPQTGGDVNRSIVSVLNDTQADTRRNAILAMRNMANPMMVEVLGKSVRDSDEHVRAYSQSILKKFHERMETRVKDLHALHEQDPENHRILLSLASVHFQSLELNIVDAESRVTVIERISGLLEKIFTFCPGNIEAHLLAVRCNLMLNQWEPASHHLHALRDQGYHSDTLDAWEWEILYQKKDWAAFNDFLRDHPTLSENPELTPLIEFWQPVGAYL